METHTAVLVFLADRVWKVKKPVRFPFVDFSTVEARRAACEREVELNRRFAPDIYLGVAEVTDPTGGPAEPAVVMRRLPDERRLATLVTAGVDVSAALRALARTLATVHAAGPGAYPSSASLEGLRARWRQLLDEARPSRGAVLPADTYDAVELLATRYLDGRGPLLAERLAAGFVSDGHGDLQADDVFLLDDGPRVLDCLEFDDRLRCVDGLDDAAFLAMDLERLGAPVAAEQFLEWYAEFRGDPAPASLVAHYVAYRAWVRATVTCLRAAQGDQASAPLAQSLAEFARARLERGRVRLVLVGGPPGSGKSTLSFALAARLGWTLVRSDVVRKELAGLAPHERAGAQVYSPAWSDKTYAAIVARARTALSLGESVVLDASWTTVEHRLAAAAVAADTATDLVALRCVVPPEVAMARVAERQQLAHDASDAGADVAAMLAAQAESWPDAVPVDTRGRPEDALAAALHALR